MKFSKFLDGIYIIGTALNDRGIIITRQEYKAIQEAFKSIPETEIGQRARLRDDTLTWDIVADDSKK